MGLSASAVGLSASAVGLSASAVGLSTSWAHLHQKANINVLFPAFPISLKGDFSPLKENALGIFFP